MKNPTRMVLTACLAAIACDGGPMAPEPCSVLNDVTLYVGEQESVTLCFVGDDDPFVEVTSSDPEIVDVTYRRDNVGLFAHSPGEATVTVTARNDDEASEQTFRAIVPNRAPQVVGDPAPATMIPGTAQQWTLAGLFEDPDDQALEYSASSSDEAVATASVSREILTVETRAAGDAEITVTASDGELSATASFDLDVIQVSTVYENTFDSGPDGWRAVQDICDGTSEVRVHDSALEVWSDDSGGEHPCALAAINLEVQHFDILARLQAGPSGSRTNIVLALLLEHSTYPQVDIVLSPSHEYIVAAWNNETEETELWNRGNVPGVASGSFVDVRWRYEGGQYLINIGDAEQIVIRRSVSSHVRLVGIFTGYAGDTGHKVRMDEFAIRGARLREQHTASTWRWIR